jgi:ABC-2 type transport system ATP-binding protein
MSTILKVANVSKSYGGRAALDNASFEIESGQIVGLLGPNGSGKTTLIKIINSLITNYTGTIEMCGMPLGKEAKALISYLPDTEFLRTDIKISTAVDMYSDFFADFDRNKAAEMIRLFGLQPNMKIGTLSKGMKEKLQLVLVMSRKAMLYIFDEPIAGVDPAARDVILETILTNYNEEGAILFSTHLISDVESILSHAVFIRDGRIVFSREADSLREERGMSIDKIFREEFKC